MPTASKPVRKPRRTKRRSRWQAYLRWALFAIASFYVLISFTLLGLRWIDPPTTAVQAERRIAAILRRAPYHKQYAFVPLSHIAPDLQHALIAAEDTRFYQHHGFDWKQIHIAVEDDLEDRRSRGASTITQQLVKNLFLSTGRSVIRKGIEFTIVPLTEAILPKQRILELYLNVIEWGPGLYGAEAAAQHYFGVSAAGLIREQAIELAEVVPSPLHRKPVRITAYGTRIMERMRQMSW